MSDLDARVAALMVQAHMYRHAEVWRLKEAEEALYQAIRAELQKPTLHEPVTDAEACGALGNMAHGDAPVHVARMKKTLESFLQGRAKPATPEAVSQFTCDHCGAPDDWMFRLDMSAHPAPSQPAAHNTADWGIDTSTGRDVLVYRNCSVIEDEQARYVLGLITAKPAAPVELPRTVRLGDAPETLNINDKAFWVIGYNKAIEDAQAAIAAVKKLG